MAPALCVPVRSDVITGRLPGAKAINALTQAEKNPDNAPARLNRIIGAMVRDMMIQKKSFLVLDWPLRAVNAKGHTKTFQMIFGRCAGWHRPWCIRATTGHSDFGFMSSSALANRYSARMGDALGGAFHVTYLWKTCQTSFVAG